MRLFLIQLLWELRKMAARPRTWLGFITCLAFDLILSASYKLPSVRALIMMDAHRHHLDTSIFSGLTSATYLLGNSAMFIGSLFLALIGADILATEAEEGTLRMVLSRPVRRGTIFLQKLIACAIYTAALGTFIAASALAVGLLFEGRGPLVVVIDAENVIGTFDFDEGLVRYARAASLLPVCLFSITLAAFACACFPMKPVSATTVALTLFLAEGVVRRIPGFAFIRDYLLLTHVAGWLKQFNNIIPTTLVRRDCLALLAFDAVMLVIAWSAFRRRDLKP